MIFKSYIVEENLEILKNNLSLFYGENISLTYEFKKKIKSRYSKNEIISFNQDEILNDKYNFINHIKNISLFNDERIFLVDNVNDKLLSIIENILKDNINSKIFLFSGPLEKKSKLRSFFEKNNNTNVIPCYTDTDLTLKKILANKLKAYSGLSATTMNMILDSCNSNRSKLYNEIDKIISYFDEKKINKEQLAKLLDLNEVEDFNLIKDNALMGNNLNTNKLLSSTDIESEKSIFYLSIINHRINRLKEVNEKEFNLESAINNLKPPLFWKDKPIFLKQAKLWDKKKLKKIIETTYNIELLIKSNTTLKKQLIIKKLLVDICNLANAA